MGILYELTDAEPVELEEMLEAREERVRLQQRFLERYKGTLISLCVNIPGPVKVFPLAVRCFEEGVRQVEAQLSRLHIPVLGKERTGHKTGWECLWAVEADPLKVKERMAQLEDQLPLGRFWDIDVMDSDGVKLSRCDLGLPERRCFLCGEAAAVCARSRAHPVEEMVEAIAGRMDRFFAGRRARQIAATAVRALLHEACTTPKPGLVDCRNSGAHDDMDLFSFLDSAVALHEYFERVARLGWERRDEDPARLLDLARFEGLLAEDAMYAATDGVNTHKGAIFLLGLLCLAAGQLGEEHPRPDALFACCARIAGGIWNRDIEAKPGGPDTPGEVFYALYGVGGARGEAERGFPSVRRCALPLFARLVEGGMGRNDAGMTVLLHLMAHVEDTNVIRRAGRQRQQALQSRLRAALRDNPTPSAGWIAALDRELIRKNISAGGCADLLAATCFVYDLCNQSEGRDAGGADAEICGDLAGRHGGSAALPQGQGDSGGLHAGRDALRVRVRHRH